MIGGHQLYLYEGDMYQCKGISAFFTNVRGHLPMLGDISYIIWEGHLPMLGGYQLYSCEGNMYQ